MTPPPVLTSPTPATPSLPILGTRVSSVTYDEAVTAILARAAEPRPGAYVCAVNVHCVSMARRDPQYRAALNGALLTVPDGQPLVWAHRVLGGRRLPDRVYGPTLMLHLCAAAAERNVPVYFYGGKPGIPELLAERLPARFPGLKVAGAFSPPFRKVDEDGDAVREEVKVINESKAGLVFIGLGAPKQELFMARHAPQIRAVQIGVGAAFDFHAGRVAQAPPWMQRAGLEWLFRLSVEPGRLWRRYVFYNPYFVARLTLQAVGLDRPSRELAQGHTPPEPPAA